MAIIRVPTDVAVSPENGSQVRYHTDKRLLFDEVGNSCQLDDPVGNKSWREAVAWAKENYPED